VAWENVRQLMEYQSVWRNSVARRVEDIMPTNSITLYMARKIFVYLLSGGPSLKVSVITGYTCKKWCVILKYRCHLYE